MIFLYTSKESLTHLCFNTTNNVEHVWVDILDSIMTDSLYVIRKETSIAFMDDTNIQEVHKTINETFLSNAGIIHIKTDNIKHINAIKELYSNGYIIDCDVLNKEKANKTIFTVSNISTLYEDVGNYIMALPTNIRNSFNIVSIFKDNDTYKFYYGNDIIKDTVHEGLEFGKDLGDIAFVACEFPDDLLTAINAYAIENKLTHVHYNINKLNVNKLN